MPRLYLVLGPTASGKTVHAIELAQQLHTEVVSCDSRQFYRELDIGVARPTTDELAAVPHHFIACRPVAEPYNVYSYWQEAQICLHQLMERYGCAVAVGGSGLYIEALCHGVSRLPDPDPALRQELQRRLHDEGVESLRPMLRQLDPDYYARVDLANGVRIQRALEVCITAGRPYSELLREPRPMREYDITPVILQRDRDELRRRIDDRVSQMMCHGLEEEARKLYPLRHLNTLNTVGYKEFFALWETQVAPAPLSSDQQKLVADQIRLNTWHYAKKQLTWLKKAKGALE